jgi:hypothetical protein
MPTGSRVKKPQTIKIYYNISVYIANTTVSPDIRWMNAFVDKLSSMLHNTAGSDTHITT